MSSDDYERTLVRIFVRTDHWWAQRAAASGSATDADLPDLTLAHDGNSFAGEVKTSGSPYVYVESEEVEALKRYADAYDMTPVIIGRFKGERAFYVWNPDDMDQTDSGNYRGMADDDNWALKIAHPEGSAEGIHPDDISSFAFWHALNSELSSGRTKPWRADVAMLEGAIGDV